MKKRISILLILVLFLLLSACGDSNPPDTPKQSAEPVEDAVNETPAPTGSGDPSPELSADIVLHSNENQFVIKMGNLYTIYSIENGAVTGMTTYCDYETADLAKRVIEQTKSENDTTIKSYRMVGSTVIISYNEQSFIGLTPEVLESFYASVKVD